MPRDEERKNALEKIIMQRVRTFSRTEKAFYGSIVVTALIMAIGIIYMQSHLLQIQSQMTEVQSKINAEKVVLDDAKQAVNELTRYNRLMEIASEAGLTFQKDNKGLPE